MIDSVAVVLAFNEPINGRDLTALAELMTESHRFVDSAGATVDGRNACVKAWRGLFDSFPDYRNVFDDVEDVGDGVVVVRGRSECPTADAPPRFGASCGRGRAGATGCLDHFKRVCGSIWPAPRSSR